LHSESPSWSFTGGNKNKDEERSSSSSWFGRGWGWGGSNNSSSNNNSSSSSSTRNNKGKVWKDVGLYAGGDRLGLIDYGQVEMVCSGLWTVIPPFCATTITISTT
jgi:hypothetical protein